MSTNFMIAAASKTRDGEMSFTDIKQINLGKWAIAQKKEVAGNHKQLYYANA